MTFESWLDISWEIIIAGVYTVEDEFTDALIDAICGEDSSSQPS